MPSANVTISVPLELLQDIDAQAKRAGLSRAAAFRQAASRWINRDGYSLDSRNPCCKQTGWCTVLAGQVSCGQCGTTQGTIVNISCEHHRPNAEGSVSVCYALHRNREDGERTLLYCMECNDHVGTVAPVNELNLIGKDA